jgi:hypothetical protein
MAHSSSMTHTFKYARTPTSTRRSIHLRRFKDPVQHDKFYAFLKHKAQARFRGELYQLTWAQWQRLWPVELWSRRGRGPQSLRLTQRNPQLGWNVKNCAIVPHGAHMSKLNQARNQARHKQHI